MSNESSIFNLVLDTIYKNGIISYMNKATQRCLNRLQVTIIPVNDYWGDFPKKSYIKTNDFVIKPNYMKIITEDGYGVYTRKLGTCYWKLRGFPKHEFAIIVSLSV